MGVVSLLGHCLANEEQCVEFVDLVGVAASRKDGIEILCDFYCVEHLLVSSFWKSLSLVSENPYLELLGGEYASLGEYVTKLIDDLHSLKIKLVMFVDGAKGTSMEDFQHKYGTWKSRHFRDLTKLRQSLNVLHQQCQVKQLMDQQCQVKQLMDQQCQVKQSMDQQCQVKQSMDQQCQVKLSMDNMTRPVLLEVQILESLRQCGCEVVQCTSFEADCVIARNLQNRPNAFAILSNDSDFCIFDNCKFIPFNLFDVNGDLGLGGKQRLPSKPEKLDVGFISSSKVLASLGFESQNEMIELSIVRGNDFTKPYLQKFGESIGLGRQSQLKDAVHWIKKHGVVENSPTFAEEMQKDRRLKEAVIHARKFYLLTLLVDAVVPHEYLTNYITDGVEKCQYPSHILAMHNGIYWHRMLVEDEGSCYPVAELALAPLRSYIYSMIPGPRNNRVQEFGRTPNREFDQFYVFPSPARFVPKVNMVPIDKIFPNLLTFHRIMSHQEEQRFQTEWHKRYGWRQGFKCYVLRYFLVLNFQQNLFVTLNEFLPLVALLFCQVDVKFYQGLRILPNSRCVTLGNWFQDIYRHAFYFIGKLLHVSHEFPPPSQVFSGAIWTAFYMLSVQDIRCVGPENIQKIRQDLDYIIREKRHIIRYLVERLFQFDTRF